MFAQLYYFFFRVNKRCPSTLPINVQVTFRYNLSSKAALKFVLLTLMKSSKIMFEVRFCLSGSLILFRSEGDKSK